jgi:hypothetical protein
MYVPVYLSLRHDVGVDWDGKSLGSVYAVSPVGRYEQAVTTAGALRLLECSPKLIVIELTRTYGYSSDEATRILREATLLDPRQAVPRRKKRIR